MKKYLNWFLMAVSMFTIIPLPKYKWDNEGGKHIMKFYPIIGLIVGIVWFGVFSAMKLLGASNIVIAAITLVAPFILTGMLHLDGYMDVCDALLSRRDKAKMLIILKDPHTGAFAVISVIMVFIVQFSALYTIVEKNIATIGLVIIPIISRSLMGYLLLSKDGMKGSSLGAFFKEGTGKKDRDLLMLYLMISLGVVVYLFGIYGVVLSLLMIGISSILVNKACKQFDGISGDTAGYGLIIAELVGVIVLSFI